MYVGKTAGQPERACSQPGTRKETGCPVHVCQAAAAEAEIRRVTPLPQLRDRGRGMVSVSPCDTTRWAQDLGELRIGSRKERGGTHSAGSELQERSFTPPPGPLL